MIGARRPTVTPLAIIAVTAAVSGCGGGDLMLPGDGVGAARNIAVLVPPSGTATSGVPFERQPRVQLRDAFGNPVAQAGIAVSAAIASGAEATLLGQRTQATDAEGVATFVDLGLAGPAGKYTLRFTSPGTAAAVSAPIDVKKIGSRTEIRSDLSQPTMALTPIVLEFRVTSDGVLQPTGTVTASDGDDSCTGSVGEGRCTLTPTKASTSPKTITAHYAGDAVHEPSSATAQHQVTFVPTSVPSFTSSPNPATGRQTITFEAVVTAHAGTPEGEVAFAIGSCKGNELGRAPVDDDGRARLGRRVQPGTHFVVACYLGTETHASSAAGPLIQFVIGR